MRFYQNGDQAQHFQTARQWRCFLAQALVDATRPSFFYKGDRLYAALRARPRHSASAVAQVASRAYISRATVHCATPSVAGCAPVDLREGPSPSMTCSCADNDTMLNCNGAAAYKVGRDLAAKTSYASYYAGFEASFSMKLDAGYDAVLRRQRLRVMLPKKAIRDKTHKLQLIFLLACMPAHHLWEKVLPLAVRKRAAPSAPN